MCRLFFTFDSCQDFNSVPKRLFGPPIKFSFVYKEVGEKKKADKNGNRSTRYDVTKSAD